MSSFALGLDFGTGAARAVIARVADGEVVGMGSLAYPSGEGGVLLDARNVLLARQNPADYLIALTAAVRGAINQARESARDFDPAAIVGVGVDTTGSSPLPVDAKNRALGTQAGFEKDLDAQCWLWKDHTSIEEAEALTARARALRPDYLAWVGDTYSSEWWWAKIWHCLATNRKVFGAAKSWVELADWIPSQLCGIEDPHQIRRGLCPAGHKALFSRRWGGLPDAAFLEVLDPALAQLRPRLFDDAVDVHVAAGALSAAWAERLGLRPGIPVGVGIFDVHAGALGCGVRPGVLVKAIGTSTCDCTVMPLAAMRAIPGVCGVADSSILPGMAGIEAGQSAVGDLFGWWVDTVLGEAGHGALTRDAAASGPGASGLLALDWNNGNRTVLVDTRLTGLLVGQTLQTTKAEIYRALIESSAFGARTILERLTAYGVPVETIVCCGGIAQKNALLMQIYADVTGRPHAVAGVDEACAFGAALIGATLAEPAATRDITRTQAAMVPAAKQVYEPRADASRIYESLFGLYTDLHDGFGRANHAKPLAHVMKDLMALRDRVRHVAKSDV